MQFGVRESAREIGGEIVVEHDVLRPPGQEHGRVDVRQSVGDLHQRVGGRMRLDEWDVAHEVGDRRTMRGGAIGRPEGSTIGA